MVNIVHIGLGKTATTTLQKHIFPNLAKNRGFVYNDQRIMPLLRKSVWFKLNESEISKVHEVLISQNNFISNESLAEWNPANWEIAAEKNIKIFGEDTNILISLREAKSYITSVYQQNVHEGNIIRPQDFFLNKTQYDLACQLSSRASLDYYCCDYLDFAQLAQFYQKRFATVKLVSMENIADFTFLDGLLDLDPVEKEDLKERFHHAPRENRAYSHMAMKMTFARDTFFRKLGAKSVGSNDLRLEDFGEKYAIYKPSSSDRSYSLPFRELSLSQKFKHAPFRLVRRVLRIPRWRNLMQSRFDRLIPYQRYQIPPGVKGINYEKIAACNEFLKELNSE